MSHRHRYRSRSRNANRRFGSVERGSWRSVSRSRSSSRHKKSRSRSRRSYSKTRRSYSNRKNSLSVERRFHTRSRSLRRTRSQETHSRHPPNSIPSAPNSDFDRPAYDFRPHLPPRWPRDGPYVTPYNRPQFVPTRHNFRARTAPLRYDKGSFKYESEEFRSKREKHFEVAKERDREAKERTRALAEYSQQLQKLVGELAGLPKDAEGREALNEQIMHLKNKMKELNPFAGRPKPPTRPPAQLRGNVIDNRSRKLFFPQLPEVATGKGNLSRWIADNARTFQPKEIAMLGASNDSCKDAIIEYKLHSTAEKVLNACKLHGIAVEWMEEAKDLADGSEEIVGEPEGKEVDYGCLEE